MPGESFNAHQQRIMIEITRLWTETDKSNEQRENREALLSQFFQTAERFPYMAVKQTVDRWTNETRWFPKATKDFADELRAARDRVTPQLENHNDPWRAIKSSSILTWARQLVTLYQQRHGHLEMKSRHRLESQAMDMALKDGDGSFGVHPHPTWSAQECLRLTRYA